MTWVKTHRRKGHFRNGRWVSECIVHEHYRKCCRPPVDPGITPRERERIKQAAAFCIDVVDDGWQEAVAGRVAGYVTEATWRQLSRRHMRGDCQQLADLAAVLLGMHDMVSDAISELAGELGCGPIVQAFVHELADKLPLGPDAHLVAVARGLQMTGVLICVSAQRPLVRCPCFRALSRAETQAQLHDLLITAMSDWRGLKDFPSANAA
jgi:hypothetical protein